jgi:prepilin-type N-terminal cleavage/methylation domain-containing protein
MTANRKSSGFTLIEMLVSTILASIVLLGLFNFTTSMVSSEVNGSRNGTVTAWSIAGIGAMNAEIAGASAIGFPPSGAGGSDELIVCTNWSMRTTPPGQVVTGPGAPSTDAYYYCWDTTDAAPYTNTLLRKVVSPVASCPTVAIACNNGTFSGGKFGADTVMATGIYRNGGAPIFIQDPNTLNAVRLQYSVGNPAANAVSAGGNGGTISATPVTVPYNTEIVLED